MKPFILVNTAILGLATAKPLAAVPVVPTQTLDKRATTVCGQWDSISTGIYILYNDLWGESSATSGSQCTTLQSYSSGSLDWSTTFTWTGGAGQVKSYAHAQVTSTSSVSSISSIASVWDWTYSTSSIVADVAYDMFTSSTATGSAQYEIMVWLAALGGAGPISSTGSAIASPVIDGVTWRLYSGPNGAMTVYSFVAASQVNNFSGDLKAFFTYLNQNQGFSTSQILQSIGAGTEVFTGSATFTTSVFSVNIA